MAGYLTPQDRAAMLDEDGECRMCADGDWPRDAISCPICDAELPDDDEDAPALDAAPVAGMEAGEPVAWRSRQRKISWTGEPGPWRFSDHLDAPPRSDEVYEAQPLYATPSAALARAARAERALDLFGQNTGHELSYGAEDEESDAFWRVHRVNGGVNDREWTLIGIGKTPLAAIEAALSPAPTVKGV